MAEFTSRLVDISMDMKQIGEAFGRWGVEHYREWELCCEALTLQWYAVQNFLALKGATEHYSDPLLTEIVRSYNRILSEYVIPDGIDPEMKNQVMIRIKQHRPNYDKVLTVGKNRSFHAHDFQADMGATYAFISGNMGSFKVRKMGAELYRLTLERCIAELGSVALEDKMLAPPADPETPGDE